MTRHIEGVHEKFRNFEYVSFLPVAQTATQVIQLRVSTSFTLSPNLPKIDLLIAPCSMINKALSVVLG